MSLLVVGSVAFDDLETPFGRREHVLGGSATYFSLSASRFHPVRIVAVVGEDFGPEQMRVFEGRPIDLAGLSKVKGLSFHWKGAYGYDLNEAKTLDTDLNVFADFKPDPPRRLPRMPLPVPREHRSGAAAGRGAPDDPAAPLDRPGHHELLDPGLPCRPWTRCSGRWTSCW